MKRFFPVADVDNDSVMNARAEEQEFSAGRSSATDIDDDLYDPMRDLFYYRAPVPSLLTDSKSKTEIGEREIVSMYSAICSPEFQNSAAELPVVIGRTIENENFTFDLVKMPHLLVTGVIGQDSSEILHSVIISLLYRKHPAQLKFVLIDPLILEFSLYSGLERHFLAKIESEDDAVVTDPQKAVYTLNAVCMEMDNRFELCKLAGARGISEYNDKFLNRRLNPQKGHRFLPYIVVAISEFADIMSADKNTEAIVMRLARKAYIVGIHIIAATQRSDAKIITSGIRVGFPVRMTCCRQGIGSAVGGRDMILSQGGESMRIRCVRVDTADIEHIVTYIAGQQGYTSAYPLPDYTPESIYDSRIGDAFAKYDPMFGEIARAAVSGGQISVSMIQRNYNVGFNRAGRIMMQLERADIVGRQDGTQPREIKFGDMTSLEAKLNDLGVL